MCLAKRSWPWKLTNFTNSVLGVYPPFNCVLNTIRLWPVISFVHEYCSYSVVVTIFGQRSSNSTTWFMCIILFHFTFIRSCCSCYRHSLLCRLLCAIGILHQIMTGARLSCVLADLNLSTPWHIIYSLWYLAVKCFASNATSTHTSHSDYWPYPFGNLQRRIDSPFASAPAFFNWFLCCALNHSYRAGSCWHVTLSVGSVFIPRPVVICFSCKKRLIPIKSWPLWPHVYFRNLVCFPCYFLQSSVVF